MHFRQAALPSFHRLNKSIFYGRIGPISLPDDSPNAQTVRTPIISRRGFATNRVPPAKPASTPRDGLIQRLLRMGCVCLFIDVTMGKRITGHDADDERLHMIPVFGNLARKLIDNDLVIPFHLTA